MLLDRLTIAKRLWAAFWGRDKKDFNGPMQKYFLAMADTCIVIAREHAIEVLESLKQENKP